MADSFFFSHQRSCFIRSGKWQRPAKRSPAGHAPRWMARPQSSTRRPQPRTPNSPQTNAVFLRKRPVIVSKDFYIGAGGDPQMQIDFAGEVLVMAVTVEETGKNRFAGCIDDLAAFRNWNFSAPRNALDAITLDHNPHIFHGVIARIDERPAGNYQKVRSSHFFSFCWAIERLLRVRFR